MPVARALAEQAARSLAAASALPRDAAAPHFLDDSVEATRRASRALGPAGREWGAGHPVRVELDFGPLPDDPGALAWQLGDLASADPDRPCEGVRTTLGGLDDLPALTRLREALAQQPTAASLVLEIPAELAPLLKTQTVSPGERWVVSAAAGDDATRSAAAAAANDAGVTLEWQLRGAPEEIEATLEGALRAGARDIAFSVVGDTRVPSARRLATALRARDLDAPLALVASAREGEPEAALLLASTELGSLLCDGLGDAVTLSVASQGGGDPARALDLAYRILQGARLRTTRTEFISCPSCGRTLFDLEETTARIKARTGHLKGVKIAIMGCIVNGPGEMADADFGYVGSGPGVVNLYVGKECVERHVPSDRADERLVELIREHGMWVDRP